MVQIKLKRKYTVAKPGGRYGASGDDQGRKHFFKHPHRNDPPKHRTMVVDGGTGKRTWQ